MVKDIMRNHSQADRQRVQTGLRNFQRQNEIRGFHGPSFRTSFFPLPSEQQRGGGALGLPSDPDASEAEAESNLSAFVCLPTLHMEKMPPAASIPEEAHRAKTLLQYHYRFGKDLPDGADSELSAAPFGLGIKVPSVRETWCLAIDRSTYTIWSCAFNRCWLTCSVKENLVTVSRHSGTILWPLSQRDQSIGRSPNSFGAAFTEYMDDFTHFHQAVERLVQRMNTRKWQIIGIFFVLMEIVAKMAATYIPMGWIINTLVVLFEKQLGGMEVTTVVRVFSLALAFPFGKNPKVSYLQCKDPRPAGI
jgi:hypothetical protein